MTNYRMLLIVGVLVFPLIGGCVALDQVAAPPSETPQPTATLPASPHQTLPSLTPTPTPVYSNDLIGVALRALPPETDVVEDQYYSDAVGFSVVDTDKRLVLAVAWRYRDDPDRLEEVVQQLIESFPTLDLHAQPYQYGPYRGFVVAGVPGIDPGRHFYLVAQGRLYEIICPERPDAQWSCDDLVSLLIFLPDAHLQTDKGSEGKTPTRAPEVVSSSSVTKFPGGPLPTATLPSPPVDWAEHTLPQVGLRVQLPAEWRVLRQPGAYIAMADKEYRLIFTTCCDNLPRTISAFQSGISQHWQNLGVEGVTITSVEGPGWTGVAVWHLPNVCLNLYIPSPQVVRQVSFLPVFCEPDGEHLRPLGTQILRSLELFP